MKSSLRHSIYISLLCLLGGITTNAQKPELVLQTGLTNGVETVAFSPDGRAVLSSTHGGASSTASMSIQLWDTRNGGLIRTIDGEEIGIATSLAVSPDGLRFAAAVGDLYVWSSTTGKLLWKQVSIKDVSGGISGAEWDRTATKAVTFSPDSKFIFSFTGRFVKVWDAARGTLRSNLTTADSAAFAPTGRYIATELNKKITIWDSVSLRVVRHFDAATSGISLDAVAFSEDGETFASVKDGQLSAWKLKTRALLRRFPTNRATVYAMALVENGRFLAQLDNAGLRLYDMQTGKPRERVGDASLYEPLDNQQPNSNKVFSPDGKVLATFEDDRIELFEVMNGKKLNDLSGGVEEATNLKVSPDQKTVAIGLLGVVELWSIETGRRIATLSRASNGKTQYSEEYPGEAQQVTFSPDSNLIAIVWPQKVKIAGHPEVTESSSYLTLFNARTGGILWARGKKDDQSIESLEFSPNGTKIAFIQGTTIQVYQSTDGLPVQRISTDSDQLATEYSYGEIDKVGFEFSSQGDEIVDYEIKNGEIVVKHIDLKTGLSSSQHLKGLVPRERPAGSGETNYRRPLQNRKLVKLSHDGSVLAVRNGNVIQLIDTGGGKKIQSIEVGVRMYDFQLSPTGKSLIAVAEPESNNIIELWDVEISRLLRSFRSPEGEWGDLRDIYFSDNGNYVFLHEGCEGGCWRGKLRVWDISNEAQLAELRFDPPDGRSRFDLYHDNVVLAGERGVRFFPLRLNSSEGSPYGKINNENPKGPPPFCSLLFFSGGTWAVVDEHGRFDTNNLDKVPYLRWFISDAPLTAYPLEIFMRDYYEPRLLARLFNGPKLTDLPSLAELNRVQPEVRVRPVTALANATNSVRVMVDVESASGVQLRDEKKVTLQSGAYDLRLFRDGQLVSYVPGKIELGAGGQATIERDVKLPRRTDLKEVEFTAYAFNSDRVKSATATDTYKLIRPLPEVKGRAYVISVGVNAYEDPAWDLSFATRDALVSEEVLGQKLTATGHYREVVPLTLISDYEYGASGRAVIKKSATKQNFHTLLELLAYGPEKIDSEKIKQIPHGERLYKAEPEDLVLIMFSSHGYTDTQGRFYLLPYDSGSVSKANDGQPIAEDSLKNFISSDELSDWVRDIDAGELVLIVDTCHSAAAVEAEGFKPGPMGSRGMGQLAYDKGMRILAASQADNVALEINTLKQGLLTYALMEEGLRGGKADKNGDGRITLDEWLTYGAERVPTLYDDVTSGRVRELNSKDPRIRAVIVGGSVKKNVFQQPQLFDFKRKKREVLMSRGN